MPNSLSPNIEHIEQRKGAISALAAYLIWGLVPLFWKQLPGIPAFELMAHRVLWCTVFAYGYLLLTGKGRFWRGIPSRTVCWLALTGSLLALNGWLYIWAVTHDHVTEGSLGYFINPLMNVVFGVLLLRERLYAVQWLAVGIATAGVIYITIASGALPWLALTISFSFACYGLIRKITPVEVFPGLFIEGLWLVPMALGILWQAHRFPTGQLGFDGLILLTGPVTAVPLLLFTYGARRLSLSTIGILQYLAPTMQLLLAVWLYHESFSAAKWIGFGMIWLSLLIYTSHSLLHQRKV
jgi:chloramphenicol-sensitive protein RarD